MSSLVCNTFTVRILREHSREMRILNHRFARQNVFQTIFLELWAVRASWAIIEDEQKITAIQNYASRQNQINNMHVIFSNNEVFYNADKAL